MRDIQPDINNFVRKTFITTADENYLTARHAFFMSFYNDFFWLSLHAIEKYFKAILLINGYSSKNYGHNIAKLHEAVVKNIEPFQISPFQNPLPQTDMHWHDETIEEYLDRLNEYGSADNRYMIYGYNQQQTDIFKIDHIIWNIRWYCKARFLNISGRTIDTYSFPKIAEKWKHNGADLPLEKILKNKDNSSSFSKMNYAFFPQNNEIPPKWQFSSKNPPLIHYIENIKGDGINGKTKKHSKDFLRWVLENFHLNKEDKKTIQNILKT